MVQLRPSVWSLTFSSPMGKVIGLVVLTTVVTLLSIGVPVLDPSVPPSNNLAVLPGAGGGVVRNCSASSPKQWQGCLKQLNEGKIQRIYVSGLLTCSPEDPCEGEVQVNRVPILIQGVPPQQSGFKRSGGGAKPLLAVHSTTDLSIRDLLFDESGGENQCAACAAVVRVSQSRRVTVRGVVMKGAKSDGILFSEVNQGVILSSEITGSGGNGVLLQHAPQMAASQFDILGNTVTNSRGAGLWISGYGTPETLARVEGNVINQNGEGIVLTGPTRHVALRGNTVVQSKGLPSGDAASGAGISLQLTAPASTNNVTDLLFERNQISWNRGAGVNRLGGDLVPCKNLQLGASNTILNNCGGSGCGGGEIALHCAELAPPPNSTPPDASSNSGSESPPTPDTPLTTLPPNPTGEGDAPISPPSSSSPDAPGPVALTTETSLLPATVVNAASLQTGEALAPGSLVTALYKTNVNSPCSATIVPLPTELCGVKVKFELEKVGVQGVEELLPVLAVERDRVTFQLPVIGTTFLLDTINTFYKVQILGPNNLTSETKILPLVHYAPALYKDSAGHGIITGSDGKRITPTNPALPGAKVVVQGTGFGFGYPGLKESEPGTVFPLETNQEGGLQLQIRDPIAVLVGGQRVQALSAFKTPKEVGNDSVIFRVPTNLSPGNYPVQACIRYDGYLPPEIAHIVKREVCSENTVMIAVDTLSQTAEYTGRVTAKVQLPNGTPLPGVTVTAQGIFEPGAALSARTAVTDSSGHAIFDVPAGERAKLRVDAQVPDGDEGGDYIFASQPELEVHSGGEAVPITVYYMTRKCFQFTTELKLSAKAKLIPGTNVYPLPNVSVVEKINGDIISRGRSDALGQYCTKRLNPGDKSKSEFVPTLWGFEFDPPTVSAAVSGNEAVKQLTITGKKKGLKQTGSAVLSGKKPQKKKAAPPKKRRAAPEKRTKGSKK